MPNKQTQTQALDNFVTSFLALQEAAETYKSDTVLASLRKKLLETATELQRCKIDIFAGGDVLPSRARKEVDLKYLKQFIQGSQPGLAALAKEFTSGIQEALLKRSPACMNTDLEYNTYRPSSPLEWLDLEKFRYSGRHPKVLPERLHEIMQPPGDALDPKPFPSTALPDPLPQVEVTPPSSPSRLCPPSKVDGLLPRSSSPKILTPSSSPKILTPPDSPVKVCQPPGSVLGKPTSISFSEPSQATR
jgi:hypothetical protein